MWFDARGVAQIEMLPDPGVVLTQDSTAVLELLPNHLRRALSDWSARRSQELMLALGAPDPARAENDQEELHRPLPLGITIQIADTRDLPALVDDVESQLRAIPDRWRLDVVIALDVVLDELLDEVPTRQPG